MCEIRRLFSAGGPRDRETALRQLAEALGYERLGPHIREILSSDLLTAFRRGILENDGGQLRLLARSIEEYTRDSLKEDFLTATGRAWRDRDEVIRSFARALGFARTGPSIDQTGRSLINGLIRDGRIEADGNLIRRKARRSPPSAARRTSQAWLGGANRRYPPAHGTEGGRIKSDPQASTRSASILDPARGTHPGRFRRWIPPAAPRQRRPDTPMALHWAKAAKKRTEVGA